MKFIISILSVLLFIMPEQHVDKVLHEGIYTNTGYGYDDQKQPVTGKSSTSFYIKIYENRLIKTMSVWGYAQPQDFEYKYVGKNEDGQRVFENNTMSSILVDNQYNIIEVFTYSSYKYGNNVKNHTYWRVVKGDHENEYNQKHKEDGSSYESQYQKYQMPEYYQIFDY